MKRKGKARRRSFNTDLAPIETNDFFRSSILLTYNLEKAQELKITKIEEIILNQNPEEVHWLNCIGNEYFPIYKKLIAQNHLDDFLTVLLDTTSQRNKLVELDNCFFFSVQSVNDYGLDNLHLESINFVVSPYFVWSIQEFNGDPFDNIRERIFNNHGIARSKKCDYLLFIIIEAVIDYYFIAYQELTRGLDLFTKNNLKSGNNQVLHGLEDKRKLFFQLKKAALGLRESVSNINNIDSAIFDNFNDKYFLELKEQCSSIIDSIDNELQRLESSSNLFFSLQNSRLNEIMKTLTIITVVFIPLSFVTGFYGMNFEDMPGLKSNNGFYIAMSIMLTLVISILYFFKRRRWF